MDWVHCNTCFTCPSTNHPIVFCLSSCGHLFCINCLKKADSTVSGNYLCKICKKKCTYLEVNRSLKSDVQMFFRHPKELLNQYMRNMKSVLEFQTFHRSHLQKHFNSKINKASKYVKQVQIELTKKTEQEKFLTIECEKLRTDLKKKADLLLSLENLIAEKDKEFIQLLQKTNMPLLRQPKHSKQGCLNLSSNTPLSTLSFINCTTSTPICDLQLFNELDVPFNEKVKTVLNTPAMLGFEYLNNRTTNFF